MNPLGGAGHLDAADRLEAGLAFREQFIEMADRVGCQAGHRLRRDGLEDHARGVGGGATGLEQRSLVDQEQVGPTELAEVFGNGATDRARSNNHEPWPQSSPHLPSV
jgi:hypothetical protein